MPIIATFTIKGISPYSQSRPHLDEMEPNESHDDYRRRTWRSHLHVNRDGEVIIPPGGIKNCISEAAKFMNISVKRQSDIHKACRGWNRLRSAGGAWHPRGRR
jgi:hypothetical protein